MSIGTNSIRSDRFDSLQLATVIGTTATNRRRRKLTAGRKIRKSSQKPANTDGTSRFKAERSQFLVVGEEVGGFGENQIDKKLNKDEHGDSDEHLAGIGFGNRRHSEGFEDEKSKMKC